MWDNIIQIQLISNEVETCLINNLNVIAVSAVEINDDKTITYA